MYEKIGFKNVKEFESKRITKILSSTNALRKVLIKYNFTLHSVLQFAWHRILYSYGNGNQTVIGTIFSGRNLPIIGVENSVGLFINTLPFIINHQDISDMSLCEAILYIQNKVDNISTKTNVNLNKLTFF